MKQILLSFLRINSALNASGFPHVETEGACPSAGIHLLLRMHFPGDSWSFHHVLSINLGVDVVQVSTWNIYQLIFKSKNSQ